MLLALLMFSTTVAVRDVPQNSTNGNAWVFLVEFKIEPLPVKGRWTTEANKERCGAALWATSSVGKVALWVTHPPASNDYLVNLFQPAPPPGPPLGRVRINIKASPKSSAISASALFGRYQAESLQGLSMKVERKEAEELLAARTLAIAAEGAPSFEIKVDQGGSGAVFDQCEQAALMEAGLDTTLPARIARWPAFENVPAWGLFTADDYPTPLLLAHVEGKVRVALEIDPTGHPASCRVVKSNNNDLLDTRTCDILLRRAKLTPALDKDGNAVAASTLTTVNWKLIN